MRCWLLMHVKGYDIAQTSLIGRISGTETFHSEPRNFAPSDILG
jgi:hypothetical protein